MSARRRKYKHPTSCLGRCAQSLCGPAQREEGNRTAFLLDPLHTLVSHGYGNNVISTSKYTWYSFLPRSLFEQFRRIANVYFLGISILMLIGTFLPKIFNSPLSAYSTLGPLCLVLAITMAKEGAEDVKRHSSDKEVNNRRCTVVVDSAPLTDPHRLQQEQEAVARGRFHEARGNGAGPVLPDGTREVLWKDLRVGMVIRVENKGEVPADVVVLQTSEPRGVCYIETSNIDGETNLKLKEAVAATANHCHGVESLASLGGELVYEPPNDRIHTFTGKLRVTAPHPAHTVGSEHATPDGFVPVGARNMVLRGCTLRNTKWMYGLVVYTGRDTKVMKKSGGARSKMSQVEKTMNNCIKIIFAAQFLLCTVTTIALALWNASFKKDYPYLMQANTELWIPEWLGDWFTFLILFNNFIPISLYVTVEMVNYVQAWLIDSDLGMYDPVSDTAAKARTSNLNQDLGQIEYIFSDKTGTLTRNVMEFKQCSVSGRVFGTFTPELEEETVAPASHAPATASDSSANPKGVGGFFKSLFGSSASPSSASPASSATAASGAAFPAAAGNRSPTATSGAFDDPVLFSALRTIPGREGMGFGQQWDPMSGSAHPSYGIVSAEERYALEAFFTCMGVCHTVVPERDEANPNAPPTYQAESPDEGALTKAARDIGFEFLRREADHIIMRRLGADGQFTDYRFDIYGTHEFNSTRKRMSVIVGAPNGKYLLMCKGADNVIFERAAMEPTRAALESHLNQFASTGLRTLVLAQRELSAEDFAAWKTEYTAASVSLVNREDMLAAVAERFETNMFVLGASAIEDRLQEGVPGTIRDLARAGIKTWVLTGDKVETAINIGFSCKLLDPSMDLIQIVAEEAASVRRQLALLEERFKPLVNDPVRFVERILRRKGKGRGRTRSTGLSVKISGADGQAPIGIDELAAAGTPHPEASDRSLGIVAGRRDTNFSVAESADERPRFASDMSAISNTIGHSTAAADGDAAPIKLQTNMAVIVTGLALTHILHDEEAERAFLTVARCCRAVIACRVSPQQKALLVRMVRRGIQPSPMTLAIGDGANDVGMIQRAEVGVGISGKEGLQAVNSSDFAIAQFRFLRRLLLVHGRWDYRRMTKVVLYSFYKNVVITFSLFFFNALTGFSGTSFYESLVYSSYNFVLGLPIVFIGILDRDISDGTALSHPAVYAVGMLYKDLNMKKMLYWIMRAVLHSAIVFWLPYGAFAPVDGTVDGQGGLVDGMSVAGLTTFLALVWAMQVKVGMIASTWTWINHLVIWLSMLGFYGFVLIYQLLSGFAPDFFHVANVAFSRPSHWLSIILVMGVMAACDFAIDGVRLEFFPTATDIAVELDRGHGKRGPDNVVRWGDEIASRRTHHTLSMALSGPRKSLKLPASSPALQSRTMSRQEPQHTSPGSSVRGLAHDASVHIDGHRASTPTKQGGSGTSQRDNLRRSLSAGPVGVGAGGAGSLATLVPSSPAGAVAKIVQSASSRGFGGLVSVPREAVMAGVDAQRMSEMGVTHASNRHGFDYSGVAKHTRESRRGLPPSELAEPHTFGLSPTSDMSSPSEVDDDDEDAASPQLR
jgi:magnesium-transporting ATPase (P-type)